MRAGAVSVNGQMWLAGSPGSAPGPLFFALCLIPLVVVFGAVGTLASVRRRREAPLRKEIQAQPLTFRSPVRVSAELFGMMAGARGNLYLNVHGDAFEIVDTMPVARFVFGMDYCYRAQDTSIQVIQSGPFECIEITGHPAGSAVRAQIRRRGMNRQFWDALVAIGVHPVGQPPQR